mmetsp:Transcript_19739/g.27532  ORF Transcript_19739/g.27532 Transcript_19739/m.27532 type:complete len:1293 (+) Transcript_19739:547-4425(+)|eukprot:CAMPEP_0168554770 /NCGR_PEP_ID=MMETSP0413-20121227/7961_1 /TAXON_ID=136452 /ORGANISM="Filamoeba nolandi, Strain NC-AS-23-1" /LENGTH=1292 /DNA_ID=CAMNT_0008585541 /DNA_START=481 /DNA_END=4359 /DNA_ORIENTATION=-
MAQASYKCPVADCARAYASQPTLQRHIQQKHPTYVPTAPDGQQHQCPKCGRFFLDTRRLNIHLSSCKNQRSSSDLNSNVSQQVPQQVPSSISPSSSSSQSERSDKHVEVNRNISQNTSDFICSYCSSTWPSQASLSQHIRNKHQSESAAQRGQNVSAPKAQTWTPDEHSELLRGVDRVGRDWDLLSRKFVPSRTAKQCENHYYKWLKAERENRAFRVYNTANQPRPVNDKALPEWFPTSATLRKPNVPPKAPTTGPAPEPKRALDPQLLTHSDWQVLSDELQPIMSKVLTFPLLFLEPAAWLDFEASVHTFVEEVHKKCSAITSSKGHSYEDITTYWQLQKRNKKHFLKLLQRISKLMADGCTVEAETLYLEVPLHVRLELPDLDSPGWTAKWSVLKKHARKAFSRSVRKHKKLLEIQQNRKIVQRFNKHPKSALRKILDDPDSEVKFPIPVAQVQDEYQRIAAPSPAVCDPPTWFSEVPWPEPPNEAEHSGSPVLDDEVSMQLGRLPSQSAPGVDGVPYLVWKQLPGVLPVLTRIFEICRLNAKVPSRWHLSRTILLYKKGDPTNVSNWRPISLQCSLYKVYAAVLAKRLVDWNRSKGTFCSAQKGFLPCDGCHEHTYMLQSCVEDSHRWKKNLHILWYDLRNAFGSVPHALIDLMARQLQLPCYFCNILHDLYQHATLFIDAADEPTEMIEMCIGVKQGDPLSPLVFNLCMEPLLRYLTMFHEGYRFHKNPDLHISALAYADDLSTTTTNDQQMHSMLRTIDQYVLWTGLQFGIAKCASYSCLFNSEGRIVAPNKPFTLAGESVPVMSLKQMYKYLGTDSGFSHNSSQLQQLIVQSLTKIDKIGLSHLEPWQKVVAIKMSVLPKLEFYMRNSHFTAAQCRQVDRKIRDALRTSLHLPSTATNTLFYASQAASGFGILPLYELQSIHRITHCVKILTSPDALIRKITQQQILDIQIQRKIALSSDHSGCFFLDWKLNDKGNVICQHIVGVSNLWFNTAPLFKKYNYRIQQRQHQLMLITKENKATPLFKSRHAVVRQLRQTFFRAINDTWSKSRSQGRAVIIAPKDALSHSWMRNSKGLTESQYRFALKTRLYLLPTQVNAHRYKRTSPMCRVCGAHLEYQNHILGHCVAVKPEIITRHNQICDYLQSKLSSSWPAVLVDQRTHVASSTLRPDLQLINPVNRTYNLIELSISYEDGFNNSFQKVTHKKHEKYKQLALDIAKLGYKTELYCLTIGYTGIHSHNVTKDLASITGLPIADTVKLLKRCSVLAIKGSYKIWRRWSECAKHTVHSP